MNDLLERIKNRVNYLNRIKYLLTSIELAHAYNKANDETKKEVIKTIEKIIEKEVDEIEIKIRLAIICENTISLTALRIFALDKGIKGGYRLTKQQLIERLQCSLVK